MFSGIGGFEIGVGDKATCVGFSEIDKYAIQIYNKHFGEQDENCSNNTREPQTKGKLSAKGESIRHINGESSINKPESASLVSNRKGHKYYGNCTEIKWQEVPDFDLLVGGFPCQAFSIAGKRGGFEDTRGTLFFEIARAIREKQPRLFLLENVKGLLSHDKGKTFLTILTTLDELGYDLQWQVLNSKNFGVPQNRERVFIVGHLRGTSRPEVFPIGENDGLCHEQSKERNQTTKKDLQDSQNRRGYSQRIRRLTPTECERLQGFPDGWTEGLSDTQRYKCLGNAVTTNVITAIMERLLNAL